MSYQSAAVDVSVGLAAGWIATKITDLAQGPLSRATPEREKAREPETLEGGSAMSAARKITERAGVNAGTGELQTLKSGIHYGLGAGWGLVYVLLRRHTRLGPMAAGAITGVALAVVIDEICNPALDITPPCDAYPLSSHIRGLAAHLVYGISLAAAGELMHRLVRRRGHWG